MLRTKNSRAGISWSLLVCVTMVYIACSSSSATGDEQKKQAALPPGVIFSSPLPDVPGKRLVVVELNFPPNPAPPSTADKHGPGHRHPGSVYVHVTKGTVRFGIEGQPVQVLRTGASFFEPPGAVHTIGENASATEPATAIAVMIVPEGAPLVQ